MDLERRWLTHALVGLYFVGWAALCKGEPPMTIELASGAFKSGAEIPRKYTEDGKDVSPPLRWDKSPAGTKEFALICDDPDAPGPEPWVHWVLYKLPADVRELPEDLPADARLESPRGALQGLNSWKSGRTIGYRGPAPPRERGAHHYRFRLYALDALLNIEAKGDKKALLSAMKGHILAEGELVGTYQR
jgi:Raf kinase inhibitor-like YbhB/YbcL family protein